MRAKIIYSSYFVCTLLCIIGLVASSKPLLILSILAAGTTVVTVLIDMLIGDKNG